MTARLRVITNNDLAYLWWSFTEKLPGCLGFTVHRVSKDGKEEPLPAWVGFDPSEANRGPRNTDVWPVQSYQWKDVRAPLDRELRYRVIPVGGTPSAPALLPELALESDWVELGNDRDGVNVTFNRGIISTQALNKALRKKGESKSSAALRQHIEIAGDAFRVRLAREMLEVLPALLKRARAEGGKCYCALYELSDEEMIGELLATLQVEIILSNANGEKGYDSTNKSARERLDQAKKEGKLKIHHRLLKGTHIGHNKFIVYVAPDGTPKAVLTGSTNWTPSGLCAQTNNALLIESEALAAHYFEYWKKLKSDGAEQGQTLRSWAAKHSATVPVGSGGSVTAWFSPNMKQKTKPPANPDLPPDLDEVFQAIENAKRGVLFLLFNPGTPSIVDRIQAAAEDRLQKGEMLYVQGAISDTETAKGAVQVFNRSIFTAPQVVVTGVAGIPDDFAFWEKELYRYGHAVIHDKIVVVDPFTKDCFVAAGSHNLGYSASYKNDENLLLFRRNRSLAEAYAAHVLDVVNHYKWRYKLQQLDKKGQLEKAWGDLAEDDRWQDKYFKSGSLARRDEFFLE